MIYYTNLWDEELILLAQQGNALAEECLIRRYETLVHQLSKGYYSKGVEREDFFQMGLIGLYKAIKSYNSHNTTKFKSFATLCIKGELATYLKFCNRHKHQLLNNAIPFLSYTNKSEDEYSKTFAEFVTKDTNSDPQSLLLNKERLRILKSIINNALTKLEKNVFFLWIEDYSYKEIAIIIGRNVKSVENSIQRIKRKLKKEVLRLSA